jgi:tRNA-2-methylthio-N6-dimethylallyladenosine synthase
MAEGYNHATGQWIGRTSQNRTLNFTHVLLPTPNGQTLVGSYLPVRVTRAGPNSLAGEAVL